MFSFSVGTLVLAFLLLVQSCIYCKIVPPKIKIQIKRLVFLSIHAGQQCSVFEIVPAISTSNDPCLLSYTCTNDRDALVWSSDLFSGNISVQAGTAVTIPSVTVSGVTLMVTDNNSTACLNSTLTFTGNLSSLTALDGTTLNCSFPGDPTDTITIIVLVPSEYMHLSFIDDEACMNYISPLKLQYYTEV